MLPNRIGSLANNLSVLWLPEVMDAVVFRYQFPDGDSSLGVVWRTNRSNPTKDAAHPLRTQSSFRERCSLLLRCFTYAARKFFICLACENQVVRSLLHAEACSPSKDLIFDEQNTSSFLRFSIRIFRRNSDHYSGESLSPKSLCSAIGWTSFEDLACICNDISSILTIFSVRSVE